jgi:hypothetical protein
MALGREIIKCSLWLYLKASKASGNMIAIEAAPFCSTFGYSDQPEELGFLIESSCEDYLLWSSI